MWIFDAFGWLSHYFTVLKKWGEPKKWEKYESGGNLQNKNKKQKKNGELLLSLEILSYRHHKSKIVILFQIWEQHRRVRLWKYQLTNYDKFPLSVKMKGLDLGHSTDHLLPRRLILFRLQKEVTKTASGNKNTTDSVKKNVIWMYISSKYIVLRILYVFMKSDNIFKLPEYFCQSIVLAMSVVLYT